MNVIESILDKNVTIETERLIVYPFNINAKTMIELYEIYSNPINVKDYCNPYNNIYVFADYMNRKIREHQEFLKGIISFVIELKESSKIIGVRNVILDGKYTLNNVETINNSNVITEILINKNYWRNGFAEEASIAIFDFLKSQEIKYVLSFIKSSNYSALKMDEKLGFKDISLDFAVIFFDFHKDCHILSDDSKNNSVYLKIL